MELQIPNFYPLNIVYFNFNTRLHGRRTIIDH